MLLYKNGDKIFATDMRQMIKSSLLPTMLSIELSLQDLVFRPLGSGSQ